VWVVGFARWCGDGNGVGAGAAVGAAGVAGRRARRRADVAGVSELVLQRDELPQVEL
jgi:hypothetical protein